MKNTSFTFISELTAEIFDASQLDEIFRQHLYLFPELPEIDIMRQLKTYDLTTGMTGESLYDIQNA